MSSLNYYKSKPTIYIDYLNEISLEAGNGNFSLAGNEIRTIEYFTDVDT